jgi:hypothetical protein
MDEGLARIEARLDELTRSLRQCEARLAALEGRAAPVGEPEPAPVAAAELPALPEVPETEGLLALGGRALLALGGAFLIRAVTEGGALPVGLGTSLGAAYALLWVGLAHRAGTRGQRLEATVLGVVAALVGNPLAWEAASRFQVLGPAGAALGVAALASALFAVAWLDDLYVLAWAASLGAIGAGGALLVSTHALSAVTALFLYLGLLTAWQGYGDKHWHGLRWPAALCADGAVLLCAALATRQGGPPEGYSDLSLTATATLGLLLAFSYMGSFAVRTLWRRRDVNVFEMTQGAAAAVVGLGSAADAAGVAGQGLGLLGGLATVMGLSTYGVAFAFLEQGADLRRSFRFNATLALALVLWGTSHLAHGSALAFTWLALGLLTGALGRHFERLSLRGHGALFLALGAHLAGVFHLVAAAFLGPPAPLPIELPVVVAVACAAAGAALVAWPGQPWTARLPSLALCAVWLPGLGALLLAGVGPLLGTADDAARLALARTLVLTGCALLLAAGPRLRVPDDLARLAPALVVLAAAKLVVEDLPKGRPATLFIAFVATGLALIVVPRLRRSVPR